MDVIYSQHTRRAAYKGHGRSVRVCVYYAICENPVRDGNGYRECSAYELFAFAPPLPRTAPQTVENERPVQDRTEQYVSAGLFGELGWKSDASHRLIQRALSMGLWAFVLCDVHREHYANCNRDGCHYSGGEITEYLLKTISAIFSALECLPCAWWGLQFIPFLLGRCGG